MRAPPPAAAAAAAVAVAATPASPHQLPTCSLPVTRSAACNRRGLVRVGAPFGLRHPSSPLCLSSTPPQLQLASWLRVSCLPPRPLTPSQGLLLFLCSRWTPLRPTAWQWLCPRSSSQQEQPQQPPEPPPQQQQLPLPRRLPVRHWVCRLHTAAARARARRFSTDLCTGAVSHCAGAAWTIRRILLLGLWAAFAAFAAYLMVHVVHPSPPPALIWAICTPTLVVVLVV